MAGDSAFRAGGPIALVTGSTSGIGRAIATQLAADGFGVVVTGTDRNRGQAVVDAITDVGGQAVFVASDLAAPASAVRAFADEVLAATGGRLDVLLSNAGTARVGPTGELADDDLDAMLAVNVRAPHVLVGRLAPAMIAAGAGCIVSVTSWMARIGTGSGALYSATKAAEDQLTRSWATEYGPQGIRVNAVAPGPTMTERNEQHRDLFDAMASHMPAGAVPVPADIAAAVSFLVSDRARSVHGTTLVVDGGFSAMRT